IKCRVGGLEPAAAVVVGTIRALKMHGGTPKSRLGEDDPAAVTRGMANLARHVENVRKFGVPPIVALNQFASDSPAEIESFLQAARELGEPVAVTNCHAHGGEGSLELAEAVTSLVQRGASKFAPLYPLQMPLAAKVETVAREVYGAEGVDYTPAAQKELARLEAIGLGEVPVCMAKTQYSFSDDPTRLGRPSGFRITVREVRPSAGAGFVVCETGEIMTMPGLPRRPAAEGMSVSADGTIAGLF
ncbi:MAG TPA: formate--tetrahydrofolate ligase, partial [Longimicrobiales bacterium]